MTHPASQTADGPMTIAAVEQYVNQSQRLIQDDLAYHFLPRSVQFIVGLSRWRPLRQMLINVSEKAAPGIWGSVICRKRYIDDTLQAANGTFDAVVNLGAGLDTRAYRMASLRHIPVFEVDLPENIERKAAIVRRLYGNIPDNVRLVPINFERQDLATVLREHGYRDDQRTFFVWEAVTQYLTEDAIRTTFDFLARAQSGSKLVFTYVRQDFLDGTKLYDSAALYQRFRVKEQLWHFGLMPDKVADFLAAYSWREVEQMGSLEMTERYLRSAGRELAVSEVERIVYAEKS